LYLVAGQVAEKGQQYTTAVLPSCHSYQGERGLQLDPLEQAEQYNNLEDAHHPATVTTMLTATVRVLCTCQTPTPKEMRAWE